MSIPALDKRRRLTPGGAGEALAAQVLAAVAGIRFGSVELVIHDGRVTQIERRERMRLTRPGSEEEADWRISHRLEPEVHKNDCGIPTG